MSRGMGIVVSCRASGVAEQIIRCRSLFMEIAGSKMNRKSYIFDNFIQRAFEQSGHSPLYTDRKITIFLCY